MTPDQALAAARLHPDDGTMTGRVDSRIVEVES
jgi:hypothetical protein